MFNKNISNFRSLLFNFLFISGLLFTLPSVDLVLKFLIFLTLSYNLVISTTNKAISINKEIFAKLISFLLLIILEKN